MVPIAQHIHIQAGLAGHALCQFGRNVVLNADTELYIFESNTAVYYYYCTPSRVEDVVRMCKHTDLSKFILPHIT